MNRRHSISLLASAIPASLVHSAGMEGIHIASNTYPWSTFARRSGESLVLHSDSLLGNIAGCGIQGYEPIFESVDEFDGLGARLKKHGLEMRSIYVNSTLHEEAKTEESIATVVAITQAAVREAGTKLVVTNPSPIRWGGDEDKTDAELRFQAEALSKLGGKLQELGVDLAYHNHDAELRNGGREFHHMLTGTDPDKVKFCLDAHWVFRGCGDSEVALFDVLDLYKDRIVELHLRQSRNGIWTETFSPTGDIDYERIFGLLAGSAISPHLVLEQAVEKETPETVTAAEAHSQSFRNLEKLAAF